ncbi:MAG: DNA-3-methyladenine glycosylase 2 family protein [Planctomycetota bacterium]
MSPQSGKPEDPTIQRRLGRMDPALGRWVQGLPALRPLQARGPLWVSLSRIVCGQQLSVAAARTIWKRLETELGSSSGRWSARSVAEADPDRLRSAGLSGAKTRAVLGLAEASVQRRLTRHRWANLSDAALIEELIALPGIGPWSAKMTLIFDFHRPDVFAPEDAGLRRAIRVLEGLDELSTDEAEARAEAWAPYRSTACRLLWHALDAEP